MQSISFPLALASIARIEIVQVTTARIKSNDAKIIKLADKTNNLRAIAFSPSPKWSVKRQLDYIDWAKKVVAELRGTSPSLEAQFDRAAEDAERSIAVAASRDGGLSGEKAGLRPR